MNKNESYELQCVMCGLVAKSKAIEVIEFRAVQHAEKHTPDARIPGYLFITPVKKEGSCQI